MAIKYKVTDTHESCHTLCPHTYIFIVEIIRRYYVHYSVHAMRRQWVMQGKKATHESETTFT